MAKRKRRRRGRKPPPSQRQPRNRALMSIGGAVLLVALALAVGIARAT